MADVQSRCVPRRTTPPSVRYLCLTHQTEPSVVVLYVRCLVPPISPHLCNSTIWCARTRFGAQATLQNPPAHAEARLGQETIRPMVSTNRRRGAAEAQRLFFIETTPAQPHLTFVNPQAIVGSLEHVAQFNPSPAGLRMLVSWGGRSRGLGWVGIEEATAWLDDQQVTSDGWKCSEHSMIQLSVTITALSPLCFSERRPGGQFRFSLDHVPGAVLRGAVASHMLRAGQEHGPTFQRLFGVGQPPAALFHCAYPGVEVLPHTALS